MGAEECFHYNADKRERRWQSKLCNKQVMLWMCVCLKKVKCHRYWPESGDEMHGPFQVVLHAMHEYPEYTLREFKMIDSRVCYP